jgi:protein phosphatase
MNVSVGAKTDVGGVRAGNEDSYLVDAPLFVVADGMGGHTGGEVASSTAVEMITETSHSTPPANIEALENYVKQANEAIWNKAQEDSSLHGMGTTCTLLHVEGSTVHIAHVGDSRAYLSRNGELSQLTEDHTLVERMVREGRLAREDAPNHPQRSIITRALGVDSQVEVDTTSIEVLAGDRLLVCSDGLSSMLDDSKIQGFLESEGDAQQTAERLIEAANEAGGEDNITVVVLDFDREGQQATTARPEEVLYPPPEREETVPAASATDDDVEHEDGSGRPRGRWGRRIATLLITLALLGGLIYFGSSYALDRMWFVGATDEGQVAVFNGLPEKVLGLNLREVAEESDVTLDDLSATYRSRVEEGVKAESQEDALQKIENMAEQSRQFDGGDGSAGDKSEDQNQVDGGNG